MTKADDAVLRMFLENDFKVGDTVPVEALEKLAEDLGLGSVPVEQPAAEPELDVEPGFAVDPPALDVELVDEPTPQPQPEPVPEPQTANRTATERETPEPAPTRRSAHARARGNRTPPPPVKPTGKPSWARRLLTYFDPPELWTHRRPSLKDVWMYARYGEWTGTGTAGRGLATVYALLVAIPAHWILGWVLFIVERFARLLTFLAVMVLLSLTPPGTHVRHALAWLLHLIANLIT